MNQNLAVIQNFHCYIHKDVYAPLVLSFSSIRMIDVAENKTQLKCRKPPLSKILGKRTWLCGKFQSQGIEGTLQNSWADFLHNRENVPAPIMILNLFIQNRPKNINDRGGQTLACSDKNSRQNGLKGCTWTQDALSHSRKQTLQGVKCRQTRFFWIAKKWAFHFQDRWFPL